MKKPIFRVFVRYSIRKKNSKVVKRAKTGIVDTFVLTSNRKEIETDEELLNRICYINKTNRDKVDITIEDIEVEAQYGETTDRF